MAVLFVLDVVRDHCSDRLLSRCPEARGVLAKHPEGENGESGGVGAGTMGHALALVFALGAHSVRLTDNDPRALDQAGTLMEAALRVLVEAGEADVGWTTERLRSAVTRCVTLEHALDGAELIVEAIIERRDAKCALYAQVDAVAPEDAILASNTSYLDIFPLVPKRRQRRTLIAHWYSPRT